MPGFSAIGPHLRKPLLIALVICSAAAAYHFGWLGSSLSAIPKSAVPPPAISVETALVHARNVPVYVDAMGTVEASSSVTVRPRIDGEIQSLSFVEGQDVKAGEILAQIDSRPQKTALAQLEASLREVRAQLETARRDLDRTSRLGDFASRQNMDAQKSRVAQLEASEQGATAQVEGARLQLDYATIRSPISGRLGFRLVDPGNMVRAGDSTGIVVIRRLRPIAVAFTLPAKWLPAVRAAMTRNGKLQVTAFDQDNRKALAEGQADLIDNTIDAGTGTIRFKAVFANDDLGLWPGQFVTARLLLAVRQEVPVVPAQAVQHGPEGAFIYVADAESRAVYRPVTVGAVVDGVAVIEGGVSGGERVVVEGQYKLQPGMPVAEAAPGAQAGQAAAETARNARQ